ncbi:uncharacterized protein LOC131240683 isoform X2 [Magnolia sinica]|uniref:uncharacterized protein LOC131240683 isoform X2 n=1 Tax=Magnolia sinica TaxID=86752 RepID=UPI00265862DE|nr:uncharacterized protein LOC131240683 isoform X2 [Magnolia sinica]
MYAHLENQGMERKGGLKDPRNFYAQVSRQDSFRNINRHVPGSSGQMTPQESVFVVLGDGPHMGKRAHNISVQTGEEFSVEFLQDRATLRRVPSRLDLERHGMRGGLNFNQNVHPGYEDLTGIQYLHPGYEDLTGILGHRRTASDCSSDASNVSLGRGHAMGVMDKGYSDQPSRVCKEITGNASSNSLDEVNCDPTIPGQIAQSGGSHYEYSHGYALHRSETSDGYQSSKMKFLCSFGGRILPRPSDGKLRYVGGETRIITIRNSLSWQELFQKTLGICNQLHTIKYQLPGEDLDALVSVSSDEDLQNMMEEYQGLECVEGSQRLRIFLISSNEYDNCSFDARSGQNNSEYHYVVAINGILDPSPRKSSSGHSLASQMGHNLDRSPSFHKDSPSLLHPLDIRDGNSPTNHAGIYSHPSGQFFIASQNATRSPNSPPFSPMPIQQKDSRNAQKQSREGQFYHVGNESAPFLTAQPPDNSYILDSSHRRHGEMAKHPHNKHADADQPVKSREVHFHKRTPSTDLARPPAYGRCDSDLGYSSREKPLLKERTFHSEKFPRQQEDLLHQLAGSKDSIGCHNGMSHALSDSQLEEHGGRSVYGLPEGPTSASTSPMNHCILPEGSAQSLKNTEAIDSKHQVQSPNAIPTCFQARQDSSSSVQHPELPDRSESVHHTDQELEGSESMMWIPTSSSATSEASQNVLKEHSRGFQVDETASAHSITANGQLYGLAKEPLKYDLGSEAGDVMTSMPSFTLSKNSPEVVGLDIVPGPNAKQQCDVSCSSDDQPCSSIDQIADISPGLPSVVTHKIMDSQEARAASSVHLSPLTTNNDAGVSLNLHTNDPTSWSVFRNPVTGPAFRGEASLLDQHLVNCPSLYVEEVPLKGEDTMLGYDESKNNSCGEIQLKSVVLVEDVTDCVPSGIHSSPTVVPHVRHATTDDLQIGDISSPKVTEAESMTPESECEDIKVDDGDMDETISDAAIAEMEAGIYGLQIIKNADLEELRELGSGTFGTVYHGKWRGTDVAIKRIKKSCFAGRSSEQERLTKDFWREAQILSKLHHPNVVAFYGVVPDGAGGTLATVTEFMVNGSLRHVLLRKDRLLDRRKRLIIAMDAAFGMEYLHSKNIVHFDLKCDNLLVNMRDAQRPICKVGDFGLSRIKRNTLVSGGVRGTLPWMAPELLNGSSSRVSEKVDVFSFGIAMWEILTGEEPYANMHCGAIIVSLERHSICSCFL